MTSPHGAGRFREDAREIVNRHDPIGLIAVGAPPTEYDCIVDETERLLFAREPLLPGLNRFMGPHFAVDVSKGDLSPMATELEQAWAAARGPDAT